MQPSWPYITYHCLHDFVSITLTDVRLTEYEMDEGDVLKRLNEVAISKREVEIVRWPACSSA